jgi:heme exporter protein A
MMSLKSLNIDNITLNRGGRVIMRDFSLQLKPLDRLSLRGNNGTGKSTLLRAIAGLLPLENGKISGYSPEEIHYLGALDALKPSLTIVENLQFWCDWYCCSFNETTLKTVGLDKIKHFPVGILSQGQKKRLSLARIIAIPRPLWLLDEPTNALDEAGQAILKQAVLNHQGITIIATHQPLDYTASEMTL